MVFENGVKMKIYTFIILAVIMGGCTLHSSFQTVEIATPGTQCPMCEVSIGDALESLDGVKRVEVNHEEHKTFIQYDRNKVSLNELEMAITRVGYQANDEPADPNAYSKLSLCCKLPKDQKNTSSR